MGVSIMDVFHQRIKGPISFLGPPQAKTIVRTYATKLPRRSHSLTKHFVKPKITRFKVIAGCLYWASRSKKAHKAKVPLDEVTRVMEGQQTKQFRRYWRLFSRPEDLARSLSLVYHGKRKEETLDLVFNSDAEFVRFKTILSLEIEKAAELFKDSEAKYLRKVWAKADKNLDGVLSEKEVEALVTTLNIKMDRKYVAEVFREIDVDGNQSLDFEEFVVLMRRLRRRPDLEGLWGRVVRGEGVEGEVGEGGGRKGRGWSFGGASRGSSNVSSASAVNSSAEEEERGIAVAVAEQGQQQQHEMKRQEEEEQKDEQQQRCQIEGHEDGGGVDCPLLRQLLPLQGFHSFLTHCQGEDDMTLAQARALLLEIDPEHGGEALSYPRFAAFMNDKRNSVLDPKKTKVVYQDMTRPLPDYYIASSHNTYLEGDQVQSASSVNRYIQDLMNGCRCVEIDCWDGERGKPLVYHGHTLTGRVRFKHVVQAIGEYAFKTSPYPVILSIENHCSLKQQKVMAKYLVKHLGDKLLIPPLEEDGGQQCSGSGSSSSSSSSSSSHTPTHSGLHIGRSGSGRTSPFKSMKNMSRSFFGHRFGGKSSFSFESHMGTPTSFLLRSPEELRGKVIVKAKCLHFDPHQYLLPSADSSSSVGSGLDGLQTEAEEEEGAVEEEEEGEEEEETKVGGSGGSDDGAGDGPRGSVAAAAAAGDGGGGSIPHTEAEVDVVVRAAAVHAGEVDENEGSGHVDLGGATTTATASPSSSSGARRLFNSMLLRLSRISSSLRSDGSQKKKNKKKNKKKKSKKNTTPPVTTTTTAAATETDTAVAADGDRGGGSVSFFSTGTGRISAAEASTPSKKKNKVAPELSRVTWMPAVRLKRFDIPLPQPGEPLTCTSYNETKMDQALAKRPCEWAELNKRRMFRVFPSPMRLDSSNYNPVPPWTVGVHMVALNYQTNGFAMQLNRGKFVENGNCGYLLKPPALRLPEQERQQQQQQQQSFHPTEGPFPSPALLEVRVISAQQLPTVQGDEETGGGSIIHPYVYLQMVGVPADQKTVSTHSVPGNGLNPVWDTSFTFPLLAPEHALLSLSVYDKNLGKADDFIASAVLPVLCMRPGFRKVNLRSFSGSKGGDFKFCSLFIFVKRKNGIGRE